MMAVIGRVLQWAMSGALGAILVGGGLSLVVFSGLNLAVETALEQAVSYISAGAGDVLQLALLCGVGEFLSLIGSAMITRAAIVAGSTVMGIRKTT